MRGKTALLTGATGGIGRELARALLAAGARVVLASRDQARGAALLRDLGDPPGGQVQPLDLAQLASVRELAAWTRGQLDRLDVVIHGAAVWPRQRKETSDGFELAFGTNHLGPFALTHALWPLLVRSRAHVVTLTSGLHGRGAIAWPDVMQTRGGFNGVRAYEQSKLANVMFTLALARRGAGQLTANAIHPGVVRTELTRAYPELWKQRPASQTSARAAATAVLRLLTHAAAARLTGRYFDGERERPPSRAASVVADQDRLWALSEQLIAAAGPPSSSDRPQG